MSRGNNNVELFNSTIQKRLLIIEGLSIDLKFLLSDFTKFPKFQDSNELLQLHANTFST